MRQRIAALVVLGLVIGGSHVVGVDRDSFLARLPEPGDHVAPQELETPVLASDRGSPTPTSDAADNVESTASVPIEPPPAFGLAAPTLVATATPLLPTDAQLHELGDLICSFDWPCQLFILIAFCESTLDADAVGKGGERGLLQVHPVHTPAIEAMGYMWDDMLLPMPNIEFSRLYLYEVYGLAPWESSSNCWN